jgi:anti-sigma factor RsiW
VSFHDDAFLDAVAALAAGALPPAEAAKTEAHLGECAVCRAELAELSAAIPVVGLAETASSETWSASAAARLKQRILHGVTQPAPVAAPHATTVPTEAMRPAFRGR